MVFGPWMMTAFRVLAPLRHVRGTPFDLFGYTAERRMERRLIEEYERMLEDVLPRLAVSTADAILALASVPEQIRGFGPVKERSVATASERTRRLLRELRSTVEVETGVTPRQDSAAA